jgi:hypothetical protein
MVLLMPMNNVMMEVCQVEMDAPLLARLKLDMFVTILLVRLQLNQFVTGHVVMVLLMPMNNVMKVESLLQKKLKFVELVNLVLQIVMMLSISMLQLIRHSL